MIREWVGCINVEGTNRKKLVGGGSNEEVVKEGLAAGMEGGGVAGEEGLIRVYEPCTAEQNWWARGGEGGEKGPGGIVHVVDIQWGQGGVEAAREQDEGVAEQGEQGFQKRAGVLASVKGQDEAGWQRRDVEFRSREDSGVIW